MSVARATIEDNVVTQLKTQISDAQIEEFPDQPQNFQARKNKCILVAYRGKNRLSNDNGRGTFQRNEQDIVLTFMYKNRRTHQGLLADLGLAETALSGYKIDGNFLSLSAEQFDEFNETRERWIYTQTYTHMERYDNR